MCLLSSFGARQDVDGRAKPGQGAIFLASGCQLVHAEEFGDAVKDWEGAPMTGLPGSLLLVGRRNG
jgi:hypothetical protein